MGKTLGPKMKWASEKIQALNDEQLNKLQAGDYLLNPGYELKNEEPVFITRQDVEVITDEIPGYEITSKGALTVALDVTLSPELKMEGVAREFVNRIQSIRKEKNFQLTDKILVKVAENGHLKRCNNSI